ncbi:MAG: hypothetical protein J7F05_10020 [Trichodesmium erythraeum GBRTRLIN201]|nr:hypothetical protein [Trichodesmium erythraeum GBRTRLIN201]
MESKFTIRDILVYFLTGLAFIVFLLPLIQDDFTSLISESSESPESEKSNNRYLTVINLLIIPVIYILGHIVDSIDIIRTNWLAKLFEPTKKNNILNKVKTFLYFLIVGDRIKGVLYFKGLNSNESFTEQFNSYWKKVNFIQTQDKYRYSEYLEVMKDLFNSLQSALLISIIYGMFISKWPIVFVYVILMILFWQKSNHYARSLTNSVSNTYKVLKENE